MLRLLLVLLLAALLPLPASATAVGLPPVVHTVMPARLSVPAIGVDAPVVALGLDADGGMAAPDGPDAVGWYTFSPTPGNPGNTVLSGHRDWRTGEIGVFWSLSALEPGDRITVVLEDGQRVDYQVALNVVIGPDDYPIEEVVGQTTVETITLITCDGAFDPVSRNYDKRRVVWGSRIPPA